MPKPNYSYEKRQRELAKKKKKEEKLREKAERKVGVAPGDESEADAQTPDEDGRVPSEAPPAP